MNQTIAAIFVRRHPAAFLSAYSRRICWISAYIAAQHAFIKS